MNSWQRLRIRIENFRELYAQHGVFVLSPRVIALRTQRDVLESEVRELRQEHNRAYERLREQDNRLWLARLSNILQKGA